MFLEKIRKPSDVKLLSFAELSVLAKEIRQKIITTVSHNGGHLASNLGVVELTIALHNVFDSPNDKIVWDVGHQCYTHKLLTGRYDDFSTLRQCGGISGFPKSAESEYDAFIAGHSGNSISAALGIAKGKRLNGDDGYCIAVIGDGSFSNGLAYEGMNHVGRSGEKIIIIINDNEMSISQNVGSLAKYLTKIRLSQPYFELKDNTKNFLDRIPLVGEPIKNTIAYSKKAVKQLVYHSNLFEDFGYKYLGPVDGHDVHSLCKVLQRAKEYACPCVVHVKTKKGKGYKPAEDNPSKFHGIGKFDISSGISEKSENSFSSKFGEYIIAAAKSNDKIAVITAAMADGTGLGEYAKLYQGTDRFFDVGIAEGHAVTFAAGLASQGIIPFFAVYSTFLQRAYDEILHDCSIEPKHVVLCIDRAGIVGADGETHQGIFDAAMLKNVPGINMYAPATFDELYSALDNAINLHKSVVAIRYPKANEGKLAKKYNDNCNIGWNYINSGCKDILLVTYGRLTEELLSAMETLSDSETRVSVMQLRKIQPIDVAAVEISCEYRRVIFYEEAIKSGGIGEGFAELLLEHGFTGKYSVHAIDNKFIAQCTTEQAFEQLGFTSKAIVKTILGELKQ